MTGAATVVRCNNGPKLVFAHFSFSHFEKRSYYRTNHIPKESVGRNYEIRLRLILLHPSCLAYIANHRLDICMRATEGSKILFAE